MLCVLLMIASKEDSASTALHFDFLYRFSDYTLTVFILIFR